MKILKNAVLGVVFLSGLTAMSNPKSSEVLAEKEQVPCSYAHTVCDNAFPDDYEGFARCMTLNGC